VNAKLSNQEFMLIQKKITQLTGIHIPQEKIFLIENKLTKLLSTFGYRSFLELYYNLNNRSDNTLTQKIFEIATNHETMWFRDKTPWRVLEDVLLPLYLSEFDQGKRSQVRIWSAACSTGQEPYSTAICINNYLSCRGRLDLRRDFVLLATDVSTSALATAKTGAYDSIAMARGLTQTLKRKYFTQKSGTWVLNEKIKKMVQFKQFNLVAPFWPLGSFDVILCRYVTIYFSDDVKVKFFNKISKMPKPKGALFLGNSEVFPNYKSGFIMEKHAGDVFYRSLN